jgi:hypothetical protein
MEFLAAKGTKLVGKDGQDVPLSSLAGKLVAFYFSVSYLPSCLRKLFFKCMKVYPFFSGTLVPALPGIYTSAQRFL